uniref:Ig-like domain-containing protein n=1 Tax=Gopherus evgoodei TaxID=1825980 RepID=A0A8C4W789_9SAUR
MGSPRLYVGSQKWSASEEAGTLKVRQDPAQILAPLGGLVELSCQINTAQRWEQLRVEWQRDSPLMVFCQVVLNKTSVSNCCRGVGVCDDARLSFTWHPPKFTLRMSNINEDDMGWYVCKAIVEIPVYLDATGNGTMLNTSGRGAGALPGQRGKGTCNTLPGISTKQDQPLGEGDDLPCILQPPQLSLSSPQQAACPPYRPCALPAPCGPLSPVGSASCLLPASSQEHPLLCLVALCTLQTVSACVSPASPIRPPPKSSPIAPNWACAGSGSQFRAGWNPADRIPQLGTHWPVSEEHRWPVC